MLEVEGLKASIEEKAILKGINLRVGPGEVHAIMGPNGGGKSTFSYVLAGRDDYEVEGGSATLNGENLLDMEPEERAAAGVFLAFQYPLEIPGVNNMYFLRTAYNALRRQRKESELDAFDFIKLLRKKLEMVGMDESFLKRGVNVGFSGGEKKRNEILQLCLLEPKLCLLDETDSGLDIDALQTIAEGVNLMRSPERSFVLVTHYQRLLEYIKPDFVHVLIDGKIVKSGDGSLAHELEKQGYAWLQEGGEGESK